MAFVKAFTGIENYLVDKIEVVGLWTELEARQVLLSRQINECKAKVGLYNLILVSEKILDEWQS